jgi:hypothetical protein
MKYRNLTNLFSHYVVLALHQYDNFVNKRTWDRLQIFEYHNEVEVNVLRHYFYSKKKRIRILNLVFTYTCNNRYQVRGMILYIVEMNV